MGLHFYGELLMYNFQLSVSNVPAFANAYDCFVLCHRAFEGPRESICC